MSLVNLPTELLYLISSNLEFVSDFNALSKSHPRLYALLHDNVYEFLKEDGGIALTWAAETGNEKCVRKLLDADAPFPNSESLLEDPMTLAAMNGHIEIVRMLLEHGRDPTPPIANTPFKAGHDEFLEKNPFAVAVQAGHTSVVKLLMEHGAVKRAANQHGDRLCDQALALAVMGMHIPIVKILLADGCDPNVLTSSGMVPLSHLAEATVTSASLEIANLLIDAGAEDLDEDQIGTELPYLVALKTGNDPFVEFLFEKGLELSNNHIIDLFSDLAGQYQATAALLLQKLDSNQPTYFYVHTQSLLMYGAAAGGFKGLLEYLLAERCDLPEIDKTRLPELVDLAVSGGHLGVLELLFKEGVPLDSTVMELTDDFPLELGDFAYPSGLFTDPFNEPTPIMLALDRGYDDVLKYLIDKGCATLFAERYGKELIFERVLYLGKVEILQMIFGTLSPDIEDIADMDAGLLIHLAVFGGENVFKFLLDQGVRLQLDYEPHQRAFANAVLLANVPIVKFFLNAGFRPNVHNWVSPIDPTLSVALDESKGGTLLAIAAQAKTPKDAEATVDLLIEHGAQMNHPTGSCDHTPLLSTVSGFAREKIYMIQDQHWTVTRTSAGPHVHHQPSRDAIEARDLEVQATKLLLKKGADPLFWGKSGRSALTMAAWNNKIEVVEVLLEFLDQADTPIDTIKPHILAAMGPYKACVGSNLHGFICDDEELDAYMNDHPEAHSDVSVEVLNQWKKAKEASEATRRVLWHWYWPKVYPCPGQ